MKGNGMPVIGMMPIVIPMFSNIWNAKIPSTPTARSVPKKSEDNDQRRTPEEAELLPHHREDEVGVLLGHVREIRLATLEQSFACEAAVDDRDLRLLEAV